MISQVGAVVNEVCDCESDQGELKPGDRDWSYEQIEEIKQKQNCLISISQTMEDNYIQSPS